MKKYPSVIKMNQLQADAYNNQALINGRWVPARPLGFMSIWERFRCAWIVFTGKGDVLIWPEGQ